MLSRASNASAVRARFITNDGNKQFFFRFAEPAATATRSAVATCRRQ